MGTTSLEEKKAKNRRIEQLKDRRDYRESLINRREEIDRKISQVEGEISELQKKNVLNGSLFHREGRPPMHV